MAKTILTPAPVRIRREAADDADVIRSITAAAFARTGQHPGEAVAEARCPPDAASWTALSCFPFSIWDVG
jgi:hypothetical protein